ncbi:hypothetical protein [Sporomusa sp. KB1]|uniref:XAC2610-related protein n=1 Tax=Sporomusa sp. KB1 TaxID=943346 RepID=UPI0011A43EDB|nr:hypothetical protein [Sporomusa sp. KB1]
MTVVFAGQPLALACEERSRLGTEHTPLTVGKDAPNVFWTIESDRINVYTAGPSRKLLLEIPYDPNYIPLADSDRLIVEDMNFDGYADLKMMVSRGMANVYYTCWLWDQAKQNFVLHKELSELSSPRFDADSKTIFSHNRSSATDSTAETYVFENSRLRLLTIMEQAYDPAKDKVIARHYSVDAQGNRQLTREQAVTQETSEAPDAVAPPFPNATHYQSVHGFSLWLPEGVTAEETAWGVKLKARKWMAFIDRLGEARNNLDDRKVRAKLEKQALSEVPLAGNRIEWSYATDTATLGGYSFYRRPFTGTVDGVEIAAGVFYYANINGGNFRVMNAQLPGIHDGLIILYRTLDTLLVDLNGAVG